MKIDIIIFLLFINIISFFICGYDKYLAKKRKFRISEKLLLSLCLIGGIFGFFAGTRVFHHKTKDKKMLNYVYSILIIWIFLLFYILICYY